MAIKIEYFIGGAGEFLQGPYYDRIHLSKNKLQELGFETQVVYLQQQLNEEVFEYPDVAVFTRWYSNDPIPVIYKLREHDVKIVYELDDNVWDIDSVNPSYDAARANRKQVEEILELSDLAVTTTPYLKEVMEEYHDNVKICPNATDFELFRDSGEDNEKLRIGWTGSVTHYEDLQIVLPVIAELQEEHDFDFIIQGICGKPIEAEMYEYMIIQDMTGNKSEHLKEGRKVWEMLQKTKFQHIPFYPPEMHSQIMTKMNLDIGLCPLVNSKFNRSKSNMKYYQYAALGAATLASDVVPYNTEIDNVVENTHKAWKKALEELITNEKKRKKLLDKQRKWVKENRTLDKVVPKTWAKYLKKVVDN